MYVMDHDTITRYAERAAMTIFCAHNIALSMKKHRKSIRFEVVDPEKAEKIPILAKSVNDLRLWNKGLEAEKIEVDCADFGTVKQRVDAMEHFLSNYKKYRFIASTEDTQCLHDMLVFSAVIRTTEKRHEQGRIIDPEVRQRVTQYFAQRDNNIGMCHAVGHAKKHGEDVQLAIEDAYLKASERSDNLIAPIWIEPLPLLPEGAEHALSWCGLTR